MLAPEHAIVLLVIIGFLFSIVVHECAHAVMAHWCGDDTALRLGRITLNPIPHIDPFLSVLLPLLLAVSTRGQFIFGGAKPVPVDPGNLRNPVRDTMWVAWAGPMSNVVLAFLFALSGNMLYLVDKLDHNLAESLLKVIYIVVRMNLGLAGFNLIPIPPLDGSRILAGLLPREAAASMMRLEPYGMLIVLVLAATGITGRLLGPVDLASHWILRTCIFLF